MKVRAWLVQAGPFIVLLLALSVRVAITATFQGLDSPPDGWATWDSFEYERLAHNLLLGGGYSLQELEEANVRVGLPTAARPPGTSLTLLVSYLVFGHSFLAAHLWIILLSSATCLATAWIGTQLGGRTVGLIAGTWLALYPAHAFYTMHFLSEPVYGFWLTLAVGLAIFAARGGSLWVSTGGGIAWAMAILTRVELILAVPIAWMLLVFAPGTERPRVFRSLALQTAVGLLIVSMWVVRNIMVIGVPTLSLQGGFTFWGAHNEVTFTDSRFAGSWIDIFNRSDVATVHQLSGSAVDRDRQAWRYGTSAVRTHLRDMPKLVIMKAWRFVSPFDTPVRPTDSPNIITLWGLASGWMLTAPFVLLGLRRIAGEPPDERWRWVILLVPILATIAMSLVFYGSPRFRDACAPLFVVLAARGATILAPIDVWLSRSTRGTYG